MPGIPISNKTVLCYLRGFLNCLQNLRVTPAFLEMMFSEDIIRVMADRTGEGKYLLASLMPLVPDKREEQVCSGLWVSLWPGSDNAHRAERKRWYIQLDSSDNWGSQLWCVATR